MTSIRLVKHFLLKPPSFGEFFDERSTDRQKLLVRPRLCPNCGAGARWRLSIGPAENGGRRREFALRAPILTTRAFSLLTVLFELRFILDACREGRHAVFRGGQMGKLMQGSVIVAYPDNVELPEKAGKLTVEEVARLEKARRGIGLACERTAEALEKNVERLKVPGVDPDALAEAGRVAEDIDVVIADVEHVLMVLKQANALLDSHAHRELRKVLAALRSQEKFDPKLGDLFQHLVAYFSSSRGGGAAPGAPPAGKPE